MRVTRIIFWVDKAVFYSTSRQIQPTHTKKFHTLLIRHDHKVLYYSEDVYMDVHMVEMMEPEASHSLFTAAFPPDKHQPAKLFETNYRVNKMARLVEQTRRSI
jgi:hypothetical protein